MKVHITSAETGPESWHQHERKLTFLHSISDQRHVLVDDPESANIILVGNVREQEGWGKRIIQNKIFKEFPGKSFALSGDDRPLFLHHGIYDNGSKNLISKHRIKTGSYTLSPEKYQNPYVKKHYENHTIMKNKEYLFTFKGRDSHPIRKQLFEMQFQRKDIEITDSSNFNLWSNEEIDKSQVQRDYCDLILNSKFTICPQGSGVNSIRLFESMQLGVAPVIISDRWRYPSGPDWQEFSITISERQIHNLEEIVCGYEDLYADMGQKARQAYYKYFSEPVYFNYLIDNCLEILRTQKIPESWYWKARYLIVFAKQVKDIVRLRSRMRLVLAEILHT